MGRDVYNETQRFSKRNEATQHNMMHAPTRPFPVVLLILTITLLVLSGCFREASDSSANPTQREVSLQDIEAQQSLTPRPTTNTATPTETLAPIPLANSPTADETLIVGGPPAEGEDELVATTAVTATDAPQPTETSSATAPPLQPPSATATSVPPTVTLTPTVTNVPPDIATIQRPGYADTGISPTPSATPRPTEVILATPTDVVPLDPCIYLVQGGDTILQISRDLDIDVDSIYAANPELAFAPDDLRIGQQIRIPDCESNSAESATTDSESDATADAPTSDTTPAPTLEGGFRLHVVQSGDTLFRLSVQYGTTVDAIVAANDRLISENTRIFPGDELRIPPADSE